MTGRPYQCREREGRWVKADLYLTPTQPHGDALLWAPVFSSDTHCAGSGPYPLFHVLGHFRTEYNVLLSCDHQGWDQNLEETDSKGIWHSATLKPSVPREGCHSIRH